MTTPGPGRPTPNVMPTRRPTAPPTRTPSTFTVASDYPKRGLPGVLSFADTGVLLFAGTDPALLGRLRAHYGGRLHVLQAVEREIRGHARHSPAPAAPADEHARVAAADLCVRVLLHAAGGISPIVLTHEDIPAVRAVEAQLQGLTGAAAAKAHAGEAEVIVLAVKSKAARPERPHVVLTNDGGASEVAHDHGLPSRHAADVLAELACADSALDADACWAHWQAGKDVSKIPGHCRPNNKGAFACARDDTDACGMCDAVAAPSRGASVSR